MSEKKVTVEEVTEKIYALRAQKSDLEAEIKKINAAEEVLEGFLLSTMQQAGLKSMSVLTAEGKVTVSHKTSRKVSVADWDTVLGYILKNQRYELLYKNINSRNTSALIDEGKEVPGVNVFSVETVSIRRS